MVIPFRDIKPEALDLDLTGYRVNYSTVAAWISDRG
jgi:hypothetical protein